MKERYTDYLHGNKELNWHRGKYEFKLDDKALRSFVGALYEVEFDLELDTETGEIMILGVNGVELKEPVKG